MRRAGLPTSTLGKIARLGAALGQEVAHRARHEDLPGLAGGLDPRRHVHRRPDGRVLGAPRAAEAAHDGRAVVDADPQLERAVEEALRLLEQEPVPEVAPPPFSTPARPGGQGEIGGMLEC